MLCRALNNLVGSGDTATPYHTSASRLHNIYPQVYTPLHDVTLLLFPSCKRCGFPFEGLDHGNATMRNVCVGDLLLYALSMLAPELRSEANAKAEQNVHTFRIPSKCSLSHLEACSLLKSRRMIEVKTATKEGRKRKERKKRERVWMKRAVAADACLAGRCGAGAGQGSRLGRQLPLLVKETIMSI